MMEVAVLIENSAMEGFACEHGLSFFIRFRGREYLLDAGSSGAFLENARRLGTVSKLAAFDAAFLFAGSLIFLLLGMSHPGVFLALLLISAFGLIVTVAAALLSHLVYKAALLREDADLTV